MSDEVFPDTLYVSGLPEVDLDEIEETFSAFGSVDSIKFLDPDKKTAFVKFNTSHEADDAYKYSKGLLIKDTLVKIGWGRRSHLNPQPPKQAPTQQTQPPQQKQLKQLSSRDHSKSHSSGSSHHHDSHHRRSSGSSSSSSSYSTRSRPSSEQNNVSSNSDRLRSSNNDTQKEYPEKAPTEKPSLLQLPSKQEAQNGLPPNPLLLQELPLRPDQEEHLALLLRKLDGSMDSIKGLSSWIVSNTFSEFDVGPMVTSIVSEMQKADHSKKLFMLFVLTDVFCQKIQTRMTPMQLDPFSAAFLKHIPTIFADIAKSATQAEKDKVMTILALWKSREIYLPSFIDTLQSFMTTAKQVVAPPSPSPPPPPKESDPSPGELATLLMYSEAKYGPPPIYYTPVNLSLLEDVDTSSVACSDEEIAALYAHFKKRVDTELGLMDKPQDIAAVDIHAAGDGEDNGDGNDDDDLDFIDGFNSFDSEDFSDSDWELDQKKPKVCERNVN